jgi:hypothetical protein
MTTFQVVSIILKNSITLAIDSSGYPVFAHSARLAHRFSDLWGSRIVHRVNDSCRKDTSVCTN